MANTTITRNCTSGAVVEWKGVSGANFASPLGHRTQPWLSPSSESSQPLRFHAKRASTPDLDADCESCVAPDSPNPSIISDRRDLDFNLVLKFEREECEVRETPEKSGLEPKTIRSTIFSLSTRAVCKLTSAGGKKNRPNYFGDRYERPVQAQQLQAFATNRDEAFAFFE